jgi:hypothetical protein
MYPRFVKEGVVDPCNRVNRKKYLTHCVCNIIPSIFILPLSRCSLSLACLCCVAFLLVSVILICVRHLRVGFLSTFKRDPFNVNLCTSFEHKTLSLVSCANVFQNVTFLFVSPMGLIPSIFGPRGLFLISVLCFCGLA